MKGIRVDPREMNINIPFNHDFMSVYSQSVGQESFLVQPFMSYIESLNSFL